MKNIKDIPKPLNVGQESIAVVDQLTDALTPEERPRLLERALERIRPSAKANRDEPQSQANSRTA